MENRINLVSVRVHEEISDVILSILLYGINELNECDVNVGQSQRVQSQFGRPFGTNY